jgi:protein-L-isoaspartate(D-aspartate) O-methyltransferase
MAAPLDLSAYPPDGMEVRLIERFVSLRNRRVLEVGCGDGRLTVQYAPEAKAVVAMDPDRPSLEAAISECHYRGIHNVTFRLGAAEHLPARGAPFDIALFSWSL